LGGQASSLWIAFVVIGLWGLLCLAACRLRRAGAALLASLAGLWLVWGLWVAPLLARASSQAPLVQRVEQAIGPDAELALVAWKEELPLAFQRQVTDFGFVTPWHQQLADAIRWQEQAPAHRWVLVLSDVMAPCIDQAATLDMGITSGRDWRLYRLDAVAPSCRGGKVPVGDVEDWGGIDRRR
jgi:hypothetical protein